MMGIGFGTGENRALDAATQAINSNLLGLPSRAQAAFCSPLPAAATLRSPKSTLQRALWKPLSTKMPTSSTAGSSTIPLGDQIRITVIATGFARQSQAAMDFDSARNDLFAATQAVSTPASSSTVGAFGRDTYTSNQTHAASPAASSMNAASTRVADEEYIPDFLRRR